MKSDLFYSSKQIMKETQTRKKVSVGEKAIQRKGKKDKGMKKRSKTTTKKGGKREKQTLK